MKKPWINPRWHEIDHMCELAEHLQSIPSFELTKRVASEILEQEFLETNPRRIVIRKFVLLTKRFMQDLYEELRPDLEKHSYNYPFAKIRIPFADYESVKGRTNYQKVQGFFRKIPRVRKAFLPKEIGNPVIPIVLPGVDYSAESLVNSTSLSWEQLPDKGRLEWQEHDSYADYCFEVMALGSQAYADLVDAWCYGENADSYFRALEVLSEEMLHHVSDEVAGPRYGVGAVSREHYWMKNYGDFPERLDIAILRIKDQYLEQLKNGERPGLPRT